MHVLTVERNRKTDTLRFDAAAGFGHGLLSPVIAYVFKTLRLSAALWEHGEEWLPIHSEPSVAEFEAEHGRETERGPYNGRQLSAVLRRRETVRGEHAGFSDLFVPVLVGDRAVAVLVTGPFARKRPASEDVLTRWRWLTGRQGHPADPEFAAYLGASLATLVLDGTKSARFEQLLERLASLLAGDGPAGQLATEAEALRGELESARLAERAWDAAREMVDERSFRRWQSTYAAGNLPRLGLSRAPDSVIVGLMASRKTVTDPVDEAIRRDTFQRRAVELARTQGDVLAGRIGDHGVTFLCATAGSARRRKRQLMDLAARASLVARRELDLSLYAGISQSADPMRLSRSYQAALGAAESALAGDIPTVAAEALDRRPVHSLWQVRQELGRSVLEQPDQLGARFDRYIEAVAAHCGYRVEAARAHLEVGFERIAEPLVGTGALDERSLFALRGDLDRAASEARTTVDLFLAYRRAVADVSQAVARPAPARHDRGLRVAVEFIGQHYAEPLRREHVARLSGFSPTYFSRLFRKREGMPFETYVLGLRLERAKQLLASTDLAVVRVAELSGFNSHAYFCRAFRRALGATPAGYRERPGDVQRRADRYKQFATKGKGPVASRPIR